MQTRNVKLDRCAMKNNYKQQVINPLLFIFIKYKKSLKIPKGVIRIRISKKNRQHNGQKEKYKRTHNDLQNIHIKLKIE